VASAASTHVLRQGAIPGFRVAIARAIEILRMEAIRV